MGERNFGPGASQHGMSHGMSHARMGHGGMGRGKMARGARPGPMRGYPPSPGRVALFSVLAAWTLAWKGASLWHAAKDDSKPWFGALLLSNTVGILDAIYIFRLSATHKKAAEKAEEAEERDMEYELPQVGHPQET
jgi:hypothetical protein